jgi:catechol 2,3-dioxygenase-like lactoylglutathione lyase family enzyme
MLAARHVGITVDDLDDMVAFYRDVLEFEVTARVSSTDEGIDAGALGTLVGIPETDLTAAFLDAPGCAVELVEYHAPPGDRVEGVANNDVGAKHLAFEVADAEAWHDRIAAAEGATPTSDPVDFGVTPRFYFSDPEGNVVELVEAE